MRGEGEWLHDDLDGHTFTEWTDAGKVSTKASNISESIELKTSFRIEQGQYGDGDVDDINTDKINQKRDTDETKIKRNKFKVE